MFSLSKFYNFEVWININVAEGILIATRNCTQKGTSMVSKPFNSTYQTQGWKIWQKNCGRKLLLRCNENFRKCCNKNEDKKITRKIFVSS